VVCVGGLRRKGKAFSPQPRYLMKAISKLPAIKT